MYDMSRVNADGYFDAMSADDRYELRERLNAQRTEDYRNGSYKLNGGVVDPIPEDAPLFVRQYHDYYKTARGYHRRSPNSNGGITENQRPVVHQHADSFLYRGDAQPRAAGSR